MTATSGKLAAPRLSGTGSSSSPVAPLPEDGDGDAYSVEFAELAKRQACGPGSIPPQQSPDSDLMWTAIGQRHFTFVTLQGMPPQKLSPPMLHSLRAEITNKRPMLAGGSFVLNSF